MSLIQECRDAWEAHRQPAEAAYKVFRSWCAWPIGGVPGIATPIRLAYRISHGMTAEQAAAREYTYRWHLALQSPIFGVPHTIGL